MRAIRQTRSHPVRRYDSSPWTVHCVIVHYDTPESLRQCIAAVQRSSGVAVAVTVVDNATLDDRQGNDVRAAGVRLIRNQRNVGFATACNQGWRAGAAAEWTLFLNPDVVVEPGTIATTIRRIGTRVGGGCRLLRLDGSLDPACKRRLPTASSALMRATGLARRFRVLDRYNASGRSAEDDWDTDALVGAFMLIRTEALAAVEGFDERFFMYAEDLDLSRRLVRRYGGLRYVGTATALHVKGESSSARPGAMQRAFFRSMRQYIFKHYPLPLAVPLAAATLLWQVASMRRTGATPR
jgi:GT2 family glycosyltransferase